MDTYPLESISVEEAKQLQFKLVDKITKHFKGSEILSLGDLGLVKGLNKPKTTLKAEETIADFFDAEKAVLVRGAGTGAIRFGLMSFIKPGDTLLVHDAPIYSTTRFTIESMGLKTVRADFNRESDIINKLKGNKIDGVIIQYTRQKIDDRYDIERVIKIIKDFDINIPVLTDDNYAVMKVKNIGIQYGADLSAFSMFKLLGPEGVGCVLGKKCYIDKIIAFNYSGGSQVQGHEAMETLRGLVYAPVQLAIQAEVVQELVTRINDGEIKGVKNAFMVNAQSKVVIVEFEKDISEKVLNEAEVLGGAPNPIGAESKYEFVPMIYRISGTFRAEDSSFEKRMIRINPMRCGADTIIRILKEAIRKAGY